MKFVVVIIAALFGLATAQSRALSIYEIQYIVDANGVSLQNGQIIDCLGGIVTHIRLGGRPRLVIQDPDYSKGWGAVQVKGWTSDAFDNITVGDWVSLTNVMVEDNKGTTFLQYQSENDPNLVIVSRNNRPPRPLVLIIDEISAPSEDIDTWIVPDHNSEKYESMLIKVVDVYVQDTGYGKAFDNYLLTSNIDPNLTCWASDYMNNDKDRGLIYHPHVEIGRNFCGVTGFLEQYTSKSEGIYYDYYQLLTTKTDDFLTLQPADFDGDCDVDFEDLNIFMGYWMQTNCMEHNNCGGADMAPEQPDGVVDMLDLIEFIQHLLEGKS